MANMWLPAVRADGKYRVSMRVTSPFPLIPPKAALKEELQGETENREAFQSHKGSCQPEQVYAT